MTSRILRVAGASLTLALGCGSAQHAAEAAESPKGSSAPVAAEAPPSASAAPAATPDQAAAGEPASDKSDGADSAKPGDAKPTASGDEKESPKAREVTFQMTPGGLVIEVEGVRLEPKAQPLKLEDGWGVRLMVRATSIDGHVHRFTRPEHGPLMVAAEIDRKGKKEHVGDERKGDGEDSVTQGTPITLERDFKKAIWSGQSVTLFVGLWGLGRDTEERRLVRKLFVVKMIAGNKKPIPVVSPPE